MTELFCLNTITRDEECPPSSPTPSRTTMASLPARHSPPCSPTTSSSAFVAPPSYSRAPTSRAATTPMSSSLTLARSKYPLLLTSSWSSTPTLTSFSLAIRASSACCEVTRQQRWPRTQLACPPYGLHG